VSFVAYRLLLLASTPYVVAAALGFAVGASNGYILNRRWTFVARDTTRARTIYVVVQVAGAATTGLLVFVLHGAGVSKGWGYVAAAPPVTLAMFVANRLWTFADPRA
jgi:putative flippase GtrA